jgi:plastocyanin
MHSAALHLAPVLAAEKSKVPFYIAGGLLVAWALTVALGLGLRRANFPGSLQGERATIAVTVVLVLAAVSTAVITSGSAATARTAASSAPASGGGQPSAPSTSTSTSTSTGTSTPTSTQPRASTGTPKAAPKTTKAAPPAATTSLALVANPQGLLSYDTKKLTAKAGTVTISLENNAPLAHNVTIAEGAKLLGATPTFVAGSRKVTLKLAPGTYTFYCSVPGHRQAGMEGTLSVS